MSYREKSFFAQKINILNIKNYNKILEAVNRGIQLALDDFDDEEQVQNIKSKQVQNRDYTKEYLDLMKDFVDLGLPSGTLWYKYNLDVDPNQLSKAEDWYGGYYAWGEIIPNNPIYDWDHYDHGYGPYNLYKYVNNKESAADDNDNKVDNLTQLLPEDDAVYQNKKFHNFKFHIPTKEQCEELIKYTSNYWINNYDPNKIIHNQLDDGGIQGLSGRVFVGKNANQMFIPAAGYRYSSSISDVGAECYLWSSSLHLAYPSFAYYLSFDSYNINIYNKQRYIGFNVRPVFY